MRKTQPRLSYPADWYIEDDEPVGQSTDHFDNEIRLASMLRAWNIRTGQNWLIGCELAFRWDENEPGVGIDPDVYVAERPPADPDGNIPSACTWKDGHSAPLLAIEIVSKSRPKKDYVSSPVRHDLLGTFELWVFDPHLYGHSKDQDAVLLQIFQRETNHCLVQNYAGEGPYRSDALDAWVMVVEGELVISYDREGQDRWLTLEEEALQYADEECARADAERARAEAERFEKEKALQRAEAERFEKEKALQRADAERFEKEKALQRAEAERFEKEKALQHAEAERSEKEKALQHADAERGRADAERSEKEKAFARIAELEWMFAQKK